MNVRWSAYALAIVALAISTQARAQSDYPSKPVRIIVDSAAGSANDAALRILADKLSRFWNQQVLTLNHPGAGGGISARVASEAPNDGYTLYMPATSPFLSLAGAPGVAPNLPIELPRDFAAVSMVLEQPLYVGASHKSGINTIADVIRLAKEKPGEVSYGATGRGRLTHLTMLLLEQRAGIKLQLIHYAGLFGRLGVFALRDGNGGHLGNQLGITRQIPGLLQGIHVCFHLIRIGLGLAQLR